GAGPGQGDTGLTAARVAVRPQDGRTTRGSGRGPAPTPQLPSVLGVRGRVRAAVAHLAGGGWVASGGQIDEGALPTPGEPSEQRQCSPDDGGHDQGAAQAGVGVGGCAHVGPPPSGGMFMAPVVARSTYTSSRARVGSVPLSKRPPPMG